MNDDYPDIARNLFYKMCETDPNKRISIYDVYDELECSDYKKYLSAHKEEEKII
jgi:hypothetical protein